MQDVTPKEAIRQQPTCDRSVALYGFLRGCNLRPGQRAHLAGVGDFAIADVEQLPDPCPLPDTIKKRGLNEQERLVYAPMSAVGGLLYDKDATYIDIPDWKVQYTRSGQEVPAEMQEVWTRPCLLVFGQIIRARYSLVWRSFTIRLQVARACVCQHASVGHSVHVRIASAACPSVMCLPTLMLSERDALAGRGDGARAAERARGC